MLVVINAVGLTAKHLEIGCTPCIAEIAYKGAVRTLGGGFPALTMSAQATMLTGTFPSQHGIVGNGWLFRETSEARLWQQSRSLVNGEFFYEKALNEGKTVAKLFWWFNQGSKATYSLTPKPYYACDGNKAFGIHGAPENFAAEMESKLGAFPFHAFWGPLAGIDSTNWIAKATAETLKCQKPDLTMTYLPHLDYDLQRFGASGPHLERNLRELDNAVKIVVDAAEEMGAEVIILSEYGITDVNRVVHINKILRENGYLSVRDGPFGELLETFQSRAFAVSDHQIAHIYINDANDIEPVRRLLSDVAGVRDVLGAEEQVEYGVNHSRSGELVALAESDSWFSWYYTLDEKKTPDFADTVDIHRKPGYDPAELLFNEGLICPKLNTLWKLLKKKLGFRTRFNLISRDALRVKGSHGLAPIDARDGAVFISSRQIPAKILMQDVGGYILSLLKD